MAWLQHDHGDSQLNRKLTVLFTYHYGLKMEETMEDRTNIRKQGMPFLRQQMLKGL